MGLFLERGSLPTTTFSCKIPLSQWEWLCLWKYFILALFYAFEYTSPTTFNKDKYYANGNENNALKNRELRIKADIDDGTVNVHIGTVNDTVFSLIENNKKITAVEIGEKLGIGLRTVKRKIKELKDNGIIARIGSDKTGHWKVLKDR